MNRGFIQCVLLALMVACSTTDVGPFEGQQAPGFQAPTISGGNFRLADALGKPTLLVFWASWCGPCKKEAPEVVRIAASYGKAVNIVGINAGETLGTTRRAAAQMGMKWPVVLDADGAISAKYKVSGIPLVLVLDADGLVRHRNNGVPTDVHRLIDGLAQ